MQIKTYMGFEVYRYSGDSTLCDDRNWPKDFKPVENSEKFSIGEQILVKDIFDHSWRPLKITKIEKEEIWAEDKSCFTTLEKENDRPYWISTGLMVFPPERTASILRRFLGNKK